MNLLDQGRIHNSSGDADAAAREASLAAGTAALDSTLSYLMVHVDKDRDAPDSVGQR